MLLVLLPAVLGLDRYVMTDDSMDGSLGRGSVALARDVPPSDLRVGDVVTFLPPGATQDDQRVTHRIVAIESGVATTQGDDASRPDPWSLPLTDATYARVWVSVPWIGYPFVIDGGWVLLAAGRRCRAHPGRRGRALVAPEGGRDRLGRSCRWAERPDHRSERCAPAHHTAAYHRDMPQRVLVVEDEEDIAFPLVRTLEREGYDVHWVDSGQKALDDVAAHHADVVILDLGLPDMDGLEVCRKARDNGYDGAIMIVTARAGELDRVVGLDYGADDYMAKPFGLAELQARVRALLRRTTAAAAAAADGVDGGLRIDVAARRVFSGDDEVPLTGKEFEVLNVLVANKDKVVSRTRLMADVWDENWYGSTKTLDVTIGRLRQKLESVGVQEKVVAVRGVGFRLEGTPSD